MSGYVCVPQCVCHKIMRGHWIKRRGGDTMKIPTFCPSMLVIAVRANKTDRRIDFLLSLVILLEVLTETSEYNGLQFLASCYFGFYETFISTCYFE